MGSAEGTEGKEIVVGPGGLNPLTPVDPLLDLKPWDLCKFGLEELVVFVKIGAELKVRNFTFHSI
jgi:hypothetical protein